MQPTHNPALHYEGHHALWKAVKYVSLALVALVAIYEHSPGLLIALAIAFVLVLALTERVKKLSGTATAPTVDNASRLLGDGGCFPGNEPENDRPARRPATVLDGGSLEHHRS